jgi:hypothetical protein
MSWVLEGALMIDLIDWMHLIYIYVDYGLPLPTCPLVSTSKYMSTFLSLQDIGMILQDLTTKRCVCRI